MTRPRSWPAGFTDLLLKALLLPEPQALAAWRSWTESQKFDDVSWHEMRILVPLAARLAPLDPQSPLRPRIDGLAKNLWTQTQLKLKETAPGLEALNSAGVPFIVFKGGAQYAEGLAQSPRRVMGDVDILVAPDRAVAALGALEADGWSATNGESFHYLREVAKIRLSGNFKKGRNGEIDLHISPFHYTRIVPELDRQLWTSAKPALLARQPVLVPDPTDSILLHLAHSAVSRSGDWVIDVATRLDSQAIDWDRLVRSADRRGLVPACRAGLRYLSEVLSVPVPAATMETLSRLSVPYGERLKYWTNVHDRGERSIFDKLGNRWADWLLRHRFSMIVKDRRAISVTRPTVPVRWFLKQGRPLALRSVQLADEQSVDLGVLLKPSHVVLKFSFASPARSRRVFFDVTANGIAVARFRTRSGGKRSGTTETKLFSVTVSPEVANVTTLSIAARPVRFMRPDINDLERADLEPIPFRIESAWLL